MRSHDTARLCLVCATPLTAEQISLNRRYCSHDCASLSRRSRQTLVCEICGRDFTVQTYRVADGVRYCGIVCKGIASRSQRKIDNNGYVWVWDGDVIVPEHQLIAERSAGRKMVMGEHVHHINSIRDDNRPENLVILSHADHMRIHHTLSRWSTNYDSCVECGTTERRHRGFGLCRRCYARQLARARRGTLPEHYRPSRYGP